MDSREEPTDGEEEEGSQSTKFLFSLHQQYDDYLKEGEVIRQRLYNIKELQNDIEYWTKNIPQNPDDPPKEIYKSVDQVQIIPISIPIRTYINEEEVFQT